MSSRPLRALIIEDDLSQAELLKEYLLLLSPGGADVETAATLKSGLALLEQGRIDVVVTDLSLPDSTGPATVSKICQQAPEVQVVVMSGQMGGQLAKDTLAAGAKDVVVKAQLDLADVVERILAAAGHGSSEGDE